VKNMFHIRLGFEGEKVTENQVKLSSDTMVYKHLVDDSQVFLETTISSHLHIKHNAAKVHIAPGMLVSQKGDDPPSMECCLRYPRPITLQFSSRRLVPGLVLLTNNLSRRVVQHNREVARNF
jgi:hypothetical protein